MKGRGMIRTKTIILIILILVSIAAAYIVVRSMSGSRGEPKSDEQKSGQQDTEPSAIVCEDRMLKITLEKPEKVVLRFRRGCIIDSEAFTLTSTVTYLPPHFGTGLYGLYLLDGETCLGVCEVTNAHSDSIYLNPTLSMTDGFKTLPKDFCDGLSFTEITEKFAETYNCTAEPNEGLMSPYTPDPVHTASLRKGSCADLSCLYVLYLRASGIPSMVIYGDRVNASGENEAHAWAEVLVDDEWKTVDITALCSTKDCSEPFADKQRYINQYCAY